MKRAGYRYNDLAAIFGISPAACFAVVEHVTYQHVTDD